MILQDMKKADSEAGKTPKVETKDDQKIASKSSPKTAASIKEPSPLSDGSPKQPHKVAQDARRSDSAYSRDKQSPRSVMYVSFGSSISLTKQEIEELAAGLEESGKFIWVVREADKADLFAGEARRIGLPDGFEERVKENGIVVRDWAPQLEILGHGSTDGFMTHCGWNSCFETLIYGVPVAAWPMHSDQHLNAIFLTEILGVGMSVRAREESAIKSVIQRLLSAVEGEGIRKRAEELSAAVKKSMEEGDPIGNILFF